MISGATRSTTNLPPSDLTSVLLSLSADNKKIKKMMRMKTATPGLSTVANAAVGEGGAHEWEVRPGGMLVQKRTDSDRPAAPPPTIRVRVKYGSICHEISINSQATFGELKKMLTGPTGLHHQDQKLLYKDKERDSNSFLDMAGVKDKSKMVLVEDPISQEKRLLEMRRNAKLEKASKSISQISLEVDRLGGQVSAYESVIGKGGKVPEKDVVNLTELLMNQLLKLDGIVADGDVKLQRKMQVRRVQKHVETLDVLKLKNSGGSSNQKSSQKQTKLAPIHEQQSRNLAQVVDPQERDLIELVPVHQQYKQRQKQQQQQEEEEEEEQQQQQQQVVMTTQWETFESSIPPPSSTTNNSAHPKFNWEFFD